MADVREQILQRQLERIAKEHNYEDYKTDIKSISSEGANYTSVLYQATISAPDKPDLNLFSKVAAVGDNFRAQMFVEIFDVENYFYNTLLNIYERIQDKYDVASEDRYRAPKFYGIDNTYLEEVLVLQDLSIEGFTTHDRLESMDWKYASKSLEQLAKWHALSIVFQEEYPDEFDKAVKVFKMQDFDENHPMVAAMHRVMASTVEIITDEVLQERLRKYLEGAGNMDFLKIFTGPMKRAVLAHGDFRMSNIMHKLEEEKLEVIPVDYQCIHLGSGVRDILFFLLSGTDEEFRGKYFFPLLDHYYEQIFSSRGRTSTMK